MSKAWTVLTNHLQDPVRARIFFELMMNNTKQVTINQIAEITHRARNTINHHIDKMLFDGILKIDKITQRGRGKPTRSFTLDPVFIKELRRDNSKEVSIDVFKETLRRKSALLAMLANLCLESLNAPEFEEAIDDSILERDVEFPMYLYSAHSTLELQIYQKHLIPAINKAKAEIDETNLEVNSDQLFVTFLGHIPVISPQNG